MRDGGTPHDALFKFTFGDPEHARGILQTALPSEISRCVDWTTLELRSTGLVDDELSQRCTDLLFRADVLGHEARVLVLFEHQSQSDRWMPLRLLEYTLRIWNDWRRDHPGASKLPAVIPVVLHHSQGGWRGATELHQLLDLDASTRVAWAPYLPNLRFVLDDLPSQSDEAIRSRALTELGKLVLLAMKHLPYAADPLSVLWELVPPMTRVLRAPNGLTALAAVLRYALMVTDVEYRDIHEVLKSRGAEELGEAVMSTADRLIEQGRTEGLHQGRTEGLHQGRTEGLHQGRAELLTRLLRRRFGELPAPVVARIDAGSEGDLDLWAERVLSAASLEDVFR